MDAYKVKQLITDLENAAELFRINGYKLKAKQLSGTATVAHKVQLWTPELLTALQTERDEAMAILRKPPNETKGLR